MTEQEAIRILGDTTLCTPLGQAAFVAIEAIKKIQQYRALGTVENIKSKINDVKTLSRMYEKLSDKEVKENRELKAYKDIGTVEELREAKEKQKPMKVTDIHVDEYYCPACGAENSCDQGVVGDHFCPECGQAIDWSDG